MLSVGALQPAARKPNLGRAASLWLFKSTGVEWPALDYCKMYQSWEN